jgi:hypothetical protein
MSKESKTMTQMRQIRIALAGLLALFAMTVGAQSASASFGLEPGSVDAATLDQNGDSYVQAGAHPFSVTTEFKIKAVPDLRPEFEGGFVPDGGYLRNVTTEAPPGLVGAPTATPRCSLAKFLGGGVLDGCVDSTQVGIAQTEIGLFSSRVPVPSPIFNLEPQPGQPALFGFYVLFVPVIAIPTIRSDGDYGLDFNVVNIDESVPVFGNRFTFWGVPASSAHDDERGKEIIGLCGDGSPRPCPSSAPEVPFLTLPVDCAHGPFAVRTEVESWQADSDAETILTHDDEGAPTGVTRCDRVPFEPSISATTTTNNAKTPSGLDFEVEIPDAGIKNPDGLAQAELKRAVVRLPEGVTLNPSAGEGLGVCTPADFAREREDSPPGGGCPNSSKLGTVKIQTPLLSDDEEVEGGLYLAQPDDPATTQPGIENPFDSLLSLYLVARVPERGVIVKAAGRVELDPATGQITTTFDDLPQLPFSSFKLHFREGSRAPLVSAPSCGEKTTEAELTPWSAPGRPTQLQAASLIQHGVGGGPCPTGGLPSFRPRLTAGSLNNAAGSFSPFLVHLRRDDGEQEITHFSIKLPPGLLGKLAGVPFCPDAAVAAAKARERLGGGREELAQPSCPAATEIGRTQIGVGVGSTLTYVPGKAYLAGPYNGSPLSLVAITSGTVGPFDVGTVVVREAFRIDPETAEVFIDATGSDPIPHIVQGVPVHARDLRVNVDRPEFVLNPTDCDRSSTASTVLGAGLDFALAADDNPFTATTPFQAADCAALPFAPRLSLRLLGRSERGAHPAFQARLRMRGIGEAAVERAQVTLPHTEFLENSHIKTICTRAQFQAGAGNGAACPAGSVYGQAKAVTPILDEALEGPVFLRSSEHKLPDLVAALQTPGGIRFDLVGRIGSVRGGGIRTTFEAAPDAPVREFVLTMQGGGKGLLVNSENVCLGVHRAVVSFTAHNGKVASSRLPLQARCGKARKRKRQRRVRR